MAVDDPHTTHDERPAPAPDGTVTQAHRLAPPLAVDAGHSRLTIVEGPSAGLARELSAGRDAWEKGYLDNLLAHFGGKVAAAAHAAGVDRVYLYRLLRRHGIKPTA